MNKTSVIKLLQEYGLVNSKVVVYDYKIFNDEELIISLDQFIAHNSYLLLPLKQIIIKEDILSFDDFDNIYKSISSHLETITLFQNKFNVKIGIDIGISFFDFKKAKSVCQFLVNNLDFINFIFNYSSLNYKKLPLIKDHIKRFCFNPIMKNKNLRLKNFPFCFIPVSKYKYLYRHIVEPLKGNIHYQSHIIKELKDKTFNYFQTCQNCRARIPCYNYCDIQGFSEYESFLSPKRENTVVFAGGSLSKKDYKHDIDIVYVSPAEQGDMFATILEGYKNILLVDGYFYSKYPPTTFEVLLAVENNINVFGSSSIGALRAVELDNYGMRGIGYVYNYLKRQSIKPYHIVAQVYDEEDRPLSTPLINIIYFLECILNEGIINKSEYEECLKVADNIHFTLLSYKYLFKELKSEKLLPQKTVLNLENYFSKLGEEYFDIKNKDALLLLEKFKVILKERDSYYVRSKFNEAKQKYMSILYDKFNCNYDFSVPENWFLPLKEAKFRTTRDHRQRTTKHTLRLAWEFFQDFDIVIADTTKYDKADNYIINIFFVPFYFLERSVSSSTGNGDVLEEALVTAYMELLERIPLYNFKIESLKAKQVEEDIFPYENLPQYYNWDVSLEEKEQTIEDLGYIKATDILKQKDVFIPLFAAMMSSDGNASGNSILEAMLYGIYELIERDISRIYDFIPDELKLKLVINNDDIKDKRSKILLHQLQEKGCKPIVYYYANIYGLPCIRCEIHDLNNRINDGVVQQ